MLSRLNCASFNGACTTMFSECGPTLHEKSLLLLAANRPFWLSCSCASRLLKRYCVRW